MCVHAIERETYKERLFLILGKNIVYGLKGHYSMTPTAQIKIKINKLIQILHINISSRILGRIQIANPTILTFEN